MTQKYTKEQANYGPGKPEHHCGICKYFTFGFRGAAYKQGGCKLVSGVINPNMGCRFYEPEHDRK